MNSRYHSSSIISARRKRIWGASWGRALAAAAPCFAKRSWACSMAFSSRWGDQVCRLALTAGGLAARDANVLERYTARRVPVAVFLAGGYARTPEETARLHLATIHAAERLRTTAE